MFVVLIKYATLGPLQYFLLRALKNYNGRSLKSEYGVFCITIGSAQLRTGYAMMPRA